MSGYGRRTALLTAVALAGTLLALFPARPFPRLEPGPLADAAPEDAARVAGLGAPPGGWASEDGARADAEDRWRDAPAQEAPSSGAVRAASPASRLRRAPEWAFARRDAAS